MTVATAMFTSAGLVGSSGRTRGLPLGGVTPKFEKSSRTNRTPLARAKALRSVAAARVPCKAIWATKNVLLRWGTCRTGTRQKPHNSIRPRPHVAVTNGPTNVLSGRKKLTAECASGAGIGALIIRPYPHQEIAPSPKRPVRYSDLPAERAA